MNVNNKEIRINISKSKAFIWTLIALGLLTILVWAFLKVWIMPTGFNKVFLLTGITLLTITSGLVCFSGLTK